MKTILQNNLSLAFLKIDALRQLVRFERHIIHVKTLGTGTKIRYHRDSRERYILLRGAVGKKITTYTVFIYCSRGSSVLRRSIRPYTLNEKIALLGIIIFRQCFDTLLFIQDFQFFELVFKCGVYTNCWITAFCQNGTLKNMVVEFVLIFMI